MNTVFFESFPAGVAYGWQKLSGYVSDLQYLFTKDGAQSIGSFGAIGSMFPSAWQWDRFWELTAFISLMLGIHEHPPYPGPRRRPRALSHLRDGHPPHTEREFMERAQIVGMSLLMLLMLYAVFNDVVRFVF